MVDNGKWKVDGQWNAPKCTIPLLPSEYPPPKMRLCKGISNFSSPSGSTTVTESQMCPQQYPPP